ncbi:MAG TPA: peptide ABC transporter substrate-binding protein, partial [Candidatus Eremiobacteraceae bacterium]|nr:peptide ABC transporter substrate-binding protein [Candidatus Eremiobacteraceae bacterium]
MRFALVRTLLFAAVLLGGGGCSRVSTSVGPGANGVHPWTQPGVLRLSDISDPSTLNPMLTGADVGYQLASYTLEYLVQLDDKGNVIPVLCERIPTAENGDISADGLSIRYHLRKNVFWSDGQPFTSQDVIESWKQVMNPLNNVQIREGYDVVAGIDALDSHTILVRLKRAYAPFTTRFFSGIQEGPIAVMPAHVIAGQSDLNHSAFNSHPIGTGPFVLQSWERNGRMIFTANQHYWRGRPKLQQIIFQAQPSTATELVRFQTHENDADFDAGPARLRELEALAGMRTMSSTSLRMLIAVTNTQRFPFNDVHVRHALAYALDRDGILQKVENGAGVLADEFLPHWSWAYTPNVPHYAFDPARAAAELEAGGYKLGADGFRYRNGRRLSAVVVETAGSSASTKIAAILQQNL